MSAIARYFHKKGINISGYDKTQTPLTDALQKEGMFVHFDDEVDRIPKDIDLVVYTPAIPAEHKGMSWLKDQKYPMMKRAEILGLVSRSQKCIAIAGTHGKTTTSTLTAFLLEQSGLSPSAFLGGIAVDFQSNFLQGDSDLVVLEADEFDRSFLHLSPDIAVILSMDADHLDIYGTDQSVKEGFVLFARQIKQGGTLLLRKGLLTYFSIDDLDFLKQKSVRILEFGDESSDFYAENISVKDSKFVFDFFANGESRPDWKSAMAGRHNVENATVAIMTGLLLDAPIDKMKSALENFKGIQRRFEVVYKGKKIIFIDDYAHHPTELRAAIDGVRMLYPDKHITGIFQPHLYSRTKDFYDGFAEALDRLDDVFLLDIYPAREKPIPGVSSQIIFDEMKNSQKTLTTKADILDLLDWENIEVLITLGAGDIDQLVPLIKEKLVKENR